MFDPFQPYSNHVFFLKIFISSRFSQDVLELSPAQTEHADTTLRKINGQKAS